MNEAEEWVARFANALIQSIRRTNRPKGNGIFITRLSGKTYFDSFTSGEVCFLSNPNGLPLAQRDSSRVITICDNLPSM